MADFLGQQREMPDDVLLAESETELTTRTLLGTPSTPMMSAGSASASAPESRRIPEHIVQFYEADTFLLDAVGAFVAAGLRDNGAVVAIVMGHHLRALDGYLQAAGFDPIATRADDRFIAIDATEALAIFMVDDVPDPARFAALMRTIIARAGAGGREVRICGEMVALLARHGHFVAASRLEALWNDLQQQYRFTLFCPYPIDCFGRDAPAGALDGIVAAHSHVIPSESYTELTSNEEQRRAIAVLQQKARLLEAEIVVRRQAEQRLRQQLETVETVSRIGQLLTSELDLNRLMQAIIRGATEIAGAEAGALVYNLIDDQGAIQTLRTLSGDEGAAFAAFPPRPTDEMAGSAFCHERIVRVCDVAAEPIDGLDPLQRAGFRPRSYLAAPVVTSRGEVTGGLFLGHSGPGVFTEQAERIVVGLAAQAAIALDNARLFRQTRDQAARQAALNAALRDAVQERDRALAEAQEAVRTRDDFIGSISHDLRNPLTTIRGYGQMLARQAAREGLAGAGWLAQGLASIDKAATRMTAQLAELVDVARLQAGQELELRLASTDLLPLVRDCIDEYRQTADQRRLRLATDLAALVGEWDGPRLSRVVGNLISNAIKYSPDGGVITVTVRRTEREAVIEVRDEGLGIPAADLAHVFDRFRRGTNVTGRIDGAGIGLAGAKQIVQQHGGSIAVESEEGHGSTFTVRLPLARVPASR